MPPAGPGETTAEGIVACGGWSDDHIYRCCPILSGRRRLRWSVLHDAGPMSAHICLGSGDPLLTLVQVPIDPSREHDLHLSVQALPQCFPIAGCVAYRGWFSEAAAQKDAARLRARGNDVWVGGVSAYSTLGWFADPLLSSMLHWDDDELDGTIFHELAHQLIYVKGDTAFNESFARRAVLRVR